MASLHYLLPSASPAAVVYGSPSAFLSSTAAQLWASSRSSSSRKPAHRVACQASKDRKNDLYSNSPLWLDRRNVLIGLGGLYGAAGLAGSDSNAAPLKAPRFDECDPADLPAGAAPTDCCPPRTTKAVDFVMPPKSAPIRVRPAAHLVSEEYVKKFEKAIELMKALPADDPRSFMQQADVHCAYCNGAHQQVGLPQLDFQIHNSWLFFPFHRWYVYFFERIAGKLIGDPNFAIPFWNWDAPGGSRMPALYTDPSSPLYDPIRDPAHVNGQIIDLDFNGVDPTITDAEQESVNLSIMYRQMVSNSKTKRLFFGSPFRAGEEDSPGGGSVEGLPHGPIHVWCGNPAEPNNENMGNFYSAARDPIFFGHHSNVDRMWVLWKEMGGKRRTDISDPDYLNTAFHFYDENAQLVRVRVGDCLDHKKLKYAYQKVDVPWMNAKPTPRRVKPAIKKKSSAGVANAAELPKKKFTDVSELPKRLNETIRSYIKRPKRSRSGKEKEDEEEELVIDLELDQSKYVKFDVYINDEDEPVSRPDNTEYAGSFVNVGRRKDLRKAGGGGHDGHGSGMIMARTCLRLGLTDLLEDLDADDDETVVVTLVPRAGSGAVKISGIRIEYDED
uniref:Tyrosinase copper-binding domain-containing protein n=1 Tax=Kalanchoe fedtschenkoi TaxID=63787 RepID=A0A7N0VLV1_KALFE